MQLAPTVKSKEAIALGLDHTLLDRMTDKLTFSYMLRVQYRMNNEILAFPNKQFYGNKLVSDPSVASRKFRDDSLPFLLIDTSGCGFEERFNQTHKSISNKDEFLIIREHLLQIREKVIGSSIGILSPYAQQVRLINEMLEDDDLEINDQPESDVSSFEDKGKNDTM